MPSCEKCWEDASSKSRLTGKDIVKCYNEILESRKYNPCTPKEQAGQFWDEEKQIDKRLL